MNSDHVHLHKTARNSASVEGMVRKAEGKFDHVSVLALLIFQRALLLDKDLASDDGDFDSSTLLSFSPASF